MIRTLACLVVAAVFGAAEDLESLYAGHEWFRLREGVQSGAAPVFYRGAAASAFHDVAAAERWLGAVIRDRNASADQVVEARLLLVGMYSREGRFRKALPHLRAVWERKKERADVANAIDFFTAAAHWPDQSTVRRSPEPVSKRMRDGNAFVPLRVNGREASWILDTGANFSTISESEAIRLGMEIRETGAKVADATGRTMGMRSSSAGDLRIGGVHLHNVFFIVVRDDQQPFNELQPGERGAIGLPVVLAAGSVAWDRQGVVEFARPAAPGTPNLAFEGAMPVAEIEFAGRRIPVHLDTGANRTHLWPKFAQEFAASLTHASKETTSYSGVGHRVEVESLKAPELLLGIGGLEVPFRPAIVLMKQEGDGAKYYYGNLGIDLLGHAKRVTIDFRSMRLSLE